MSLDGLTGAATYAILGAEAMVLLSCFTISALIVCGIRFSAPANIHYFNRPPQNMLALHRRQF